MAEWVNVIGRIPVPTRANDAGNAEDYRRVQLRLYRQESAGRPWVLQARLWEDDKPLEQWTRTYESGAVTQANTAYETWMTGLAHWLDGLAELSRIRPQRIDRRPGWIEGTPWGVA